MHFFLYVSINAQTPAQAKIKLIISCHLKNLKYLMALCNKDQGVMQ